MAAWLKNHPFAVRAHLARTTVLTFAAPTAALQPLIPECLKLDTLDTLDDAWGFVAVALVQTRALRPQGLPAWLGHDFFLIGYRVFVRYRTLAGKNLRGLYILKSETDRPKMEWLGNLFTSYRYATIDLRQTATADALTYESAKAGLHIAVGLPAPAQEPALPAGSPFASWAQARRFAGPLPFTFSFAPATRQVTVVEGVREDWHPQAVEVRQAAVGFLAQLALPGLRLASAFTMTDIPYRWKKGRTELWKG